MLLEGHPLADVVRLLAERGWEGTATELLAEVNHRTSEDVKRRREWYAQPKQLGDELRRLTPALRKVGITVTRRRLKKVRLIRIRRGIGRVTTPEKTGTPASSASPPSPDPPILDRGDAGDAGDAVG